MGIRSPGTHAYRIETVTMDNNYTQNGSLRNSFDELNTRNARLEQQIAEYSDKLEHVKNRLQQEIALNDRAQKKEDTFLKAIEILRNKVTELESASKNVELSDEARARIEKAEAVVADLRARLSDKDAEIVKLNETINTLNIKIDSYDAVLQSNQKQLADDQIVINSLTDRITKQNMENGEMHTEIEEKSKNIDALTSRIESLESKVKYLEDEILALKTGIRDAREKAKAETEDRNVEKEILKQIEFYRQQASILQKDLDKFGRQIENFENYIYSQRRRNEHYGQPGYFGSDDLGGRFMQDDYFRR